MGDDVKGEPRERRRRVPRAIRERQMVEIATEQFGRRGYDAVSMDDVARRAGVTKPMLYAYFGSKDGLFAAAAEAAGQRLEQALREVVAVPGRHPDERLWHGLLAVFAFVEEHREAWRMLYPHGGPAGGAVGAGASRARDSMSTLLHELFGDVARGEGLEDWAAGQAALMAPAFTAATIAAASAWLDSDEPRELAALRLMNLFWNGFGDLLAGRLWLPES